MRMYPDSSSVLTLPASDGPASSWSPRPDDPGIPGFSQLPLSVVIYGDALYDGCAPFRMRSWVPILSKSVDIVSDRV